VSVASTASTINEEEPFGLCNSLLQSEKGPFEVAVSFMSAPSVTTASLHRHWGTTTRRSTTAGSSTERANLR